MQQPAQHMGQPQANPQIHSAPVGQPAQSERPRPRLQHANPTQRDQFSGLDEPNLSTRPQMRSNGHPGPHSHPHSNQGAYDREQAQFAQSHPDSAFWQFEGGQGQPRNGERGSMAPFILLGLILLAFMVGWGAWASWTAWQSSAPVNGPLFLSAPLRALSGKCQQIAGAVNLQAQV